MNQTIHTHQIIHAFAHRNDAKTSHVRSRGNGVIRTSANRLNGRRRANARAIVTAVIMFLPVVVTEFLIGEFAPDGWFGDVLNQTSQLLALASPF